MNPRPDDSDCLAAALRVLARRDHSCAELSRKLERRGYSTGQIKSVVDKCLALDYLNERRFARSYAGERQRKGYGRRYIAQALAAKGLSSEVIEAALAACCQDGDQVRGCRQAMLKKCKALQSVEKPAAAKAKLYRFLTQRGFPAHIIGQVMDEDLGPTVP
jgi:regulatory protein